MRVRMAKWPLCLRCGIDWVKVMLLFHWGLTTQNLTQDTDGEAKVFLRQMQTYFHFFTQQYAVSELNKIIACFNGLSLHPPAASEHSGADKGLHLYVVVPVQLAQETSSWDDKRQRRKETEIRIPVVPATGVTPDNGASGSEDTIASSCHNPDYLCCSQTEDQEACPQAGALAQWESARVLAYSIQDPGFYPQHCKRRGEGSCFQEYFNMGKRNLVPSLGISIKK